MKPDLRQAWENQVLVGDGAMGTYLYQKGFPVGISYEELNLTSWRSSGTFIASMLKLVLR